MVSFLGSYERPRRQPLGEVSRIGRLVRLSEDTLSAVVDLGNEQFELPVSPGKYVLGANVAVLESKGKPRRVTGPAGLWPEGLDADADAPDTVTAVEQLGPVEFSPEDQAILDQTVADLGEAQADLALKADSSALAALAGVVDGLDIPDISGLASKAEMDAAAQAAEDAAKEHADLVAAGASADAIATAAADAQTKADAAEAAAKAHADDRYDVLKDFADDLQVVADQAAVDAAAAQAKANAAVADTKVEYAVNTSETAAPTSGWSTSTPTRTPGSYVWMRTTITYGDGTPAVLAPVLVTGNDGATGDPGSDGADGISVTSVTPFYRQATSEPDKPSGASPSGWSTTEPEYVEDTSVWRSDRVVYSNDLVAWTDVSKSSSYELAKAAKAAAEAAQADATAAHLLALDGEVALDRLISGQLKPTVVEALIADLAIIDYLEATEAWVGGSMMKDGAVTAEALNVVHIDPVTGYGWRAEPEGLVFLDRDGAPMITLRTDMANAFTVMKDGIPVATISPDGDVTGVNLVAHESFRYRGQELADLIDQQPRGEITASNLSEPLLIGIEWARVGHVTWTSDSGSRRYKATLSLATNNGTSTRVQVSARRSTGNTVESTNSLLQIFEHGDGRERNTRVHEFDFNSALTEEQSVGFFVRCVDGGTVTAMASNAGGATTKVTLADTGRAITEEPYIGYSPPIPGGGGGSGSDDAPAKSQHSKTFTATSFRTYSRTGLTHTRASQSVVHGAIAGSDSRGHWIWNIAAIRSALSGATNITGKLVIPVEHTYYGDGTDFVIKKHNYTSLPSTFGTAREWQTVRGKRQTEIVIPLDATTLNQLQGVGTATAGFSADPGAGTGLRNYGYLSPDARLQFDYRK